MIFYEILAENSAKVAKSQHAEPAGSDETKETKNLTQDTKNPGLPAVWKAYSSMTTAYPDFKTI